MANDFGNESVLGESPWNVKLDCKKLHWGRWGRWGSSTYITYGFFLSKLNVLQLLLETVECVYRIGPFLVQVVDRFHVDCRYLCVVLGRGCCGDGMFSNCNVAVLSSIKNKQWRKNFLEINSNEQISMNKKKINLKMNLLTHTCFFLPYSIPSFITIIVEIFSCIT